MKYLKLSENIKDYLDWFTKLKKYDWQIQDENIENRKKLIIWTKYFTELKKLAENQNIEFNDIEIISWLDSMTIIKEVLIKLSSDKYIHKENILNELKIIQELHIPFTNKRSDFVLFKDNKILIIEFSFAKWNKEYRYEYKLNQAIGYKECLENILPRHIEIATYTFIIKPENKESTTFPNNHENIENLKNFIINFFSNTKKDALTELSKIQVEQ